MSTIGESARATAAREATRTGESAQREGLVVAGGLLGAIAASSCCIVPLVLFTLGASGAWVGNLTALAPYQPFFVAVALGFLGYGYYLVYWKPRRACAAGQACAPSSPTRMVKGTLWAATLLVAAAIGFPYIAPILLDV